MPTVEFPQRARAVVKFDAEGRALVSMLTSAGVMTGYLALSDVIDRGWTQWRPRSLRPQPAPRWISFLTRACAQLGKREAWNPAEELEIQVAREIVAEGFGGDFLRAARRGRGTGRQTQRWRLLREVELLTGDTVPRRRDTANTPEAKALAEPVGLEFPTYEMP